MSAMFFYLAQDPEAYKTLAEEIRTTFKSGQDIRTGSKLNGCSYLRACIDETLRMSPPGLAISWRQQEPGDNEPFVVDGHVIPKGTQVGISLYSLLHNEDYFPDPFTFKPERWLQSPRDNAGKPAATNARKAFAPFLIGDRSCAGKSMAYMEISLTIARCFWYFDFHLAQGKAGEVGGGREEYKDGRHRPGEYQLHDIFISSHQGPNLVFHKLGDAWKELEGRI